MKMALTYKLALRGNKEIHRTPEKAFEIRDRYVKLINHAMIREVSIKKTSYEIALEKA